MTRKSIARTAAATAGLALVATGALAPAVATEGKGSARSQERVTAAQAEKADRQSEKADRKGEKADKADRSRGRSATAPHGNAYGHAEDKQAAKSARNEGRGEQDDARQDGEKSNNGLGDERGNGHTPVTVCHALGNGGFVEITFDENALDKHLENHMKHMADHQDYRVEEGTGCEDVAPATETRETVDTEVLGVEAFRGRTGAGTEAPAVLGAEAVAPGSAAVPAAAGPVAGILPQTGAAPLALAAAAGLGLVGAGATMVARRRREA